MDASLFEQVSMIGSEEEPDPTKLIRLAVAQLNNWCKEERPIPESESESKSESSLICSFESLESVLGHNGPFLSPSLNYVPQFYNFNKEHASFPYILVHTSLLSTIESKEDELIKKIKNEDENKELINFGIDEDQKSTYISPTFHDREGIIELIREFVDVFA